MKPGSVIVDLAAATGGNVETTVKDKVITTPNGVTCIGYTDLPSRLPTTSSSLYSNNAMKFVLSMGPQTTKKNGKTVMDGSLAAEACFGVFLIVVDALVLR